MDELMIMVYICQTTGWDFYTYMNQPEWFLDLFKWKLEFDSKKQK
jgi:hypothetical protein